MSLLETKAAYRRGELTKPDYIRAMHEFHRVLFEYTRLIGDTDVARIEITDAEVVMTMRESGVRMACDPLDHRIAPLEILNFGAYEASEARVMASLFRDGGTLFDVGANFGWYSLTLSKQVPGLTVHAFEPVRRTFDYLVRNIELNAASRVVPHDFGFSTADEELTFYFYPEGSGNASMANVSERDGVEEVTCRVVRMDDFVARGRYTVDYLKCDVEGAELRVFEGGLATIREQRPMVFTEMLRKWSAKFGYHPNRIIELFADAGYRCFTATGSHIREFFIMDDDTVETNFFFLHADKHERQIRAHLEHGT